MTIGPALIGVLAASLVISVAARVAGWATSTGARALVTVDPPSRSRWGWLPRRGQGRRRPPGDVDVATWCERVASGIRSGSSLTRAVLDADAATPVELRPYPEVVLAVHRGRSLAEALRSGPADPSTAVGLAAPVLATCAEVGGTAAEAVDRVGAVLLARAAERDERRAGSAQARLSARVMTSVPFGVAALLALTEPAIRATLTTAAGLLCIGLGGTLNLAGWWWMRSMIAGAT